MIIIIYFFVQDVSFLYLFEKYSNVIINYIHPSMVYTLFFILRSFEINRYYAYLKNRNPEKFKYISNILFPVYGPRKHYYKVDKTLYKFDHKGQCIQKVPLLKYYREVGLYRLWLSIYLSCFIYNYVRLVVDVALIITNLKP